LFLFFFFGVFSFVHISERFARYSRDYQHSFFLLVFWFLLLLESYIDIWIMLPSWFYLVLVLDAQEPQEGTIMSDQNNTQPPPDVELKFQMQAMKKMMERMNSMMGNVCDRLEKVGKQGIVVGTCTQDV